MAVRLCTRSLAGNISSSNCLAFPKSAILHKLRRSTIYAEYFCVLFGNKKWYSRIENSPTKVGTHVADDTRNSESLSNKFGEKDRGVLGDRPTLKDFIKEGLEKEAVRASENEHHYIDEKEYSGLGRKGTLHYCLQVDRCNSTKD